MSSEETETPQEKESMTTLDLLITSVFVSITVACTIGTVLIVLAGK